MEGKEPEKRARGRRSTMFRMIRGGPALVAALDYGFIALITLNVIAVILETVKSIHDPAKGLFRWFEVFSVIVFTIEYLVRLYFSPQHESGRYRHPVRGRLLWALSPLALVDLLAVLPFYISLIGLSVDLRFLRALRLIRIFKLTRYSPAMGILLRVLKEEMPSFGAALFILVVILILAASGIYLVEHEAQPEAFGSIPSAMWWAVATLTTVGYGDVTPTTAAGKMFGSLVTIVGIGMVALPAGILSSAFSDHLRRRREEYRELLEEAMEDGELTAKERRELRRKREELALDADDARRMREAVDEAQPVSTTVCPRCGHRFDAGETGGA